MTSAKKAVNRMDTIIEKKLKQNIDQAGTRQEKKAAVVKMQRMSTARTGRADVTGRSRAQIIRDARDSIDRQKVSNAGPTHGNTFFGHVVKHTQQREIERAPNAPKPPGPLNGNSFFGHVMQHTAQREAARASMPPKATVPNYLYVDDDD